MSGADQPSHSGLADSAGTFYPAARKVFIIAGLPASGKGTQCQLLAERFGMVHFSTGDFFRREVRCGTEMGMLAKEFIDRNEFVPDDVVITAIKHRLAQSDVASRGILLDGFPRTPEQAHALVAQVNVDHVVALEVPRRILVSRALTRRIDPETQEIYNLVHKPPPSPEIETRCTLHSTSDGDEASFNMRLDTHAHLLRRVLPIFAGKVTNVLGMQEPENVFRSIVKAINKACGHEASSSSANSSEAGPKKDPLSTICVVCMDDAAACLVAPCGHQCGCHGCLSKLQKCPICRGPVESVVKVFQTGLCESSGPRPATDSTDTNHGKPSTESGNDMLQLDSVNVTMNSGSSSNSSSSSTATQDINTQLDVEKDEELDSDWDPDDELADISNPLNSPFASSSGSCRPVISVAPSEDIRLGPGQQCIRDVAISISCPDSTTSRIPTDVVCVVDVSASMSAMATYEDQDTGEVKNDGLSRFDLVKHAVKTVMHTLSDSDRLSLVTFSSSANEVFGLKYMNAAGRADAVAALEAVQWGGQTNIWDGIHCGMEALQAPGLEGAEETRQKSLLLLTDGQPNIVPPAGHIPELKRYLEGHSDLHFQLNTFGFGYQLDSQLLVELAKEGNGTFAFIPDAVIIGTTFVDCCANILSCATQDATLHLQIPSHSSIQIAFHEGASNLTPSGGRPVAVAAYPTPSSTGLLGGLQSTDTSWGKIIRLGPLQYGQQRDIVVQMSFKCPPDFQNFSDADCYLTAALTFPNLVTSKDDHVETKGTTLRSSVDARIASVRSRFVEAAYMAVAMGVSGKGKEASKQMKSAVQCIDQASPKCLVRVAGNVVADPRIESLRADVAGRATKALDGQARFKRWGKHYLRALGRSHQLQLCTNFMDKGLQVYGGEAFRQLRGEGDQVFLNLPMPKPVDTRRLCDVAATGGTAHRAPPPVSNATYYGGGGGGCFGGNATVSMIRCSDEGGNSGIINVPVSDVGPGDKIKVVSAPEANDSYSTATVRCVVRLVRPAGSNELITFPSGLCLTRSHPMFVNGSWQRPRDVAGHATNETASKKNGDPITVYNFVLDRTGVVPVVNGVPCAVLGHGLSEDVIAHRFLGNMNSITSNLSQLPGWSEGVVEVSGCLRDQSDGEIVSFLGSPDTIDAA